MPTTFKALDPSTGEELAAYAEATRAELDRAVAAAVRSAADPHLADPARRVVLLRTAAARLRARGEEVVALAERETGLPASPRLQGELGRTCGQLEAFADVVEEGSFVGAILDAADPSATPPRPDLRRMLHPIGPVAVFGASNFPLAFSTAGGDTASALAAGCPVVVKGHPSHPGTGALVAEELTAAVAEAGLPVGTFAFLPSAGPQLGAALVDAPGVRAVAFTGSSAAGRALMDRAAARPDPIPVFAEMGSLNPVVVTEGALRDGVQALAELLAGSVATFGGQLCTKPGVVFVPDSRTGDAFAESLAQDAGERDPQVLLGPGILERFSAGLQELPAQRLTPPAAPAGPGFRHAPVVLEVPLDGLTGPLLEEHFGPATVVVRYPDLSAVGPALERLHGQLTTTFHHAPDEVEQLAPLVALAQRLSGRVLFGGVPTGVAVAWSTQHGGPWPASSSPHTSVGMTALERFLRPVALQDAPPALLPPALQDGNPLGIWRRVDGELTRD